MGKSLWSNLTWSTRAFLAQWYLQNLALGVLWSIYHDRLTGGTEGDWVFTMFVWIAIVWMLLVGNHMATGSWVLRGLRSWP